MAEFNLWLLIVGIVAGAAVTWLAVGTISRNDDEVAAAERPAEAAWIAGTIEEHGGRAPIPLVEQILMLHRRYLQGGAGVPLPTTEPETVDGASGPDEAEAVDGASRPGEAAGDTAVDPGTVAHATPAAADGHVRDSNASDTGG